MAYENFNLKFALRLAELILVSAAFILYEMSLYHEEVLYGIDVLNISANIYLIIIAVVILLLVFKDIKVEAKLIGVTFCIGGLLMLGSGITVAILVDYSIRSWRIPGIIGAVGGGLLFIDGLKSLDIF